MAPKSAQRFWDDDMHQNQGKTFGKFAAWPWSFPAASAFWQARRWRMNDDLHSVDGILTERNPT
ncbi:MAG: hypothetical protein EOR78_12270 [Mesorhizobium sp.]|nr:MAG: hypothetical protein EOR49_04430 [Mesorhizobium sp.]RWM46232.1 MAG: hypothetical protein EOR76_18715 [Mesorhizobium sp.]RWM56561.1 MAG: hypothetical protein EOR78_12270 [Mesorhizobium sp.]RWM61085.1 MAG: hypothetical protein EOR79_06170 [Mesorhizobium sp.]RWN05459.1 MAG: hypothetical protein EOR85_01975 [Mesorhizobium sp.]